MANKIKKILLTGGGTGGSVMPLLAIAEEITSPPALLLSGRGEKRLPAQAGSEGVEYEFLWLGTRRGPESEMVKKENIKFRAIANGKLRRYFSWHNFIDPFLIKIGFWQAFFIIFKWRPNLVISAGSFVGVPVVWAAWILRVPVLIHQQDVKPGLANRLMAPFAQVITVTFEKSLDDYGQKAVWTGNPVQSKKVSPLQRDRKARSKNCKEFRLKNNLPTVLILGGGTGALAINKLVEQSVNKLTKFCQIIHLTGKDKALNYKLQITNYINYEFLDTREMADAFSAADVVISRCGMGVLTELSYLGKPAILIPIPDSHQEENAQIFYEQKAAIVLDQDKLTAEKFVAAIKELINDTELRNKLRNNIKRVIKPGANKKMVKIIKEMIK
jgi:UDP-N-acetylglucosamine--N-acetylmuramyl-(pentapeptide) pyrophosphoryl-undecaprenol N-acetylglucosamine transferase